MSACPTCEGIRQKRRGAWWCFWCKESEPTDDVRDQLQNEWDRRV